MPGREKKKLGPGVGFVQDGGGRWRRRNKANGVLCKYQGEGAIMRITAKFGMISDTIDQSRLD